MDHIEIINAKVHNLKSISLKLPRNKLVVITGPSGSGKSSLAFDTLYAEGQRRYIESLSSYARQFLGQMDPPDVESITGLSPAIAIDQKASSKNPRSTVGTVTEVYDYLRLFYARLGTPYCPISKEKLEGLSADQITKILVKKKSGTKIQLLAPVLIHEKGEHKDLFAKLLAQGYQRARVNNKIMLIEEIILEKNKKNTVDVIIDRLVIKDGIESRLNDSVEQSLKLGEGKLFVLVDDAEEFYSETLYSPKSGKSYPPLEPRLFSFNSPLGACENCKGLGYSQRFAENKFITDESLSIREGALAPLGRNSFLSNMIENMADAEGVNIDVPYAKLNSKFKELLFKGRPGKKFRFSFVSDNSRYEFQKEFLGLANWLQKKYETSTSDKVKQDLEALMEISPCQDCQGKRLNAYALNVKVNDVTIMDFCEKPLAESYHWISHITFEDSRATIYQKLIKEIGSRLKFLLDVGLSYLSLNRAANTLSGGEAQRIRLATQIGSSLTGVLYILDEPSIGLHQRDNSRLIKTLKALRDLDNTVIVVEHDEETMKESDYILDLGPGAGLHGGMIVAAGTPEQVMKNPNSLTGQFLSGKNQIEVPKERRKLKDFITLKDFSCHNIKNLTVKLPLGGLVCITGVSGSGKSSLIHQGIFPGCDNALNRKNIHPIFYKAILGTEKIQSIIQLDQSPIGRTPKSNPATYTKVFDEIRTLFGQSKEAKAKGYLAGRFSFNVKGGRCEACEGQGNVKVEMSFLPDVYIQCDACKGLRYNSETLLITFKGKNIADVLDMSVDEAILHFNHFPKITRTLETLQKIGLGYMKLGQGATTLSGGEAQRLKLSRELSKRMKGHCLYLLDEPTTGLHFNDIKILLKALHQLVDQGNTIVVIEHNLDVIKSSDYIIDMGPEGGSGGGNVVVAGTPEEVAQHQDSFTGMYLKPYLTELNKNAKK